MHRACIGLSQCWGKKTQSPHLQLRGYLQLITTYKGKISFLQRNLIGIQNPPLRAGCMSSSKWATQNKPSISGVFSSPPLPHNILPGHLIFKIFCLYIMISDFVFFLELLHWKYVHLCVCMYFMCFFTGSFVYLFCPILVCFYLIFKRCLFVFQWERKKEYKLKWVGKWGGSEGVERETTSEYILWKNYFQHKRSPKKLEVKTSHISFNITNMWL